MTGEPYAYCKGGRGKRLSQPMHLDAGCERAQRASLDRGYRLNRLKPLTKAQAAARHASGQPWCRQCGPSSISTAPPPGDYPAMMCLSGCVGRLRDLDFLRAQGHGRLLNPDRWKNPKPGIPYGLDNGAFPAYTHGHLFPEDAFLAMLAKVPRHDPPILAVCPDRVAAGLDSLTFSSAWRTRLSALGYDWMPWYFAVQDGMTLPDVEAEIRTGRWAGLFVGGTLHWKHDTAASWVRLAHLFDLKCHIGRVYQLRDLLWAERIGADSVDSTGWARNDRHSILEALAAQQRLPVPP